MPDHLQLTYAGMGTMVGSNVTKRNGRSKKGGFRHGVWGTYYQQITILNRAGKTSKSQSMLIIEMSIYLIVGSVHRNGTPFPNNELVCKSNCVRNNCAAL